MLLGNVGASSSQTFTLDHTPQFIGVKFGATGDLTGIQFVGPDGLQVNLSDAAVKAVGRSMSLKALSATGDIFLIPVAAGFIGNESTSIQVTTGAGAGGVDIYDISLVGNPAGLKFVTAEQGVIANGNTSFEKFSKLILLSPGANDVLNVMPMDGTIGTKMQVDELAAIANLEVNNSSDLTIINNSDKTVRSIVYNPIAQRTVVKMSMMAAGTTSSSGIMQVMEANVKAKVRDQKVLTAVNMGLEQSSKLIK